MDSSLNRFNRIAKLYDPLASIVFGRSLHNAQLVFLDRISPQANVLILGGGTGKILNDLLRANAKAHIYYIEASSSMIELARKNVNKFHTQVHFIHGTENAIPQGIQFDVVITNFFLDMFSSSAIENVIRQVVKPLKNDAIWIVTDFIYSKKIWHRMLLHAMYLFFRNFCGIEAKQLPDWENHLKRAGLRREKSELFYDGFIKSALYHYVA
jgi:ubiquinone/menaquinone biosynthesis C-methylase UbiE